jgi:hypothetical protein
MRSIKTILYTNGPFVSIALTKGNQVISLYGLGPKETIKKDESIYIKQVDELINNINLYGHMVYMDLCCR